MHLCPNCDQACHCNGDATETYSDLQEPNDNCTHCLNGLIDCLAEKREGADELELEEVTA